MMTSRPDTSRPMTFHPKLIPFLQGQDQISLDQCNARLDSTREEKERAVTKGGGQMVSGNQFQKTNQLVLEASLPTPRIS